MNTITEKALRAAIIFWDRKHHEKVLKGDTEETIFSMQADEAAQELIKQGCTPQTRDRF